MEKHYKNYYNITAKPISKTAEGILVFNVLDTTFTKALKQSLQACKKHELCLMSITQDTFHKLSRQN